MISLQNITIASGDKQIVKGLSLELKPGEFHLFMGPNGSGKSTLAHALMGNPAYEIQSGAILLEGECITYMSPDKRAQKGIFLSYQLPPVIPGVATFSLMLEMHRALHGLAMNVSEFRQQCLDYCTIVGLNPLFLDRSLHEGCSGGERKRIEMLQFLVSKPQFLILDELDSGLDADGVLVMQRVLEYMRASNPNLTILMITHYPPKGLYHAFDRVHVMQYGSLLVQGGKELAEQIAHNGYHHLGDRNV